MNDIEYILKITEEESNEIKENSPYSLPLNPTSQGYSGQEIRKKLYKSIVGEKGSVLAILKDRLIKVSAILNNIENYTDEFLELLLDQLLELKEYVEKNAVLKDGSVAMEEDLNINDNDIVGVNNIEVNGILANNGIEIEIKNHIDMNGYDIKDVEHIGANLITGNDGNFVELSKGGKEVSTEEYADEKDDDTLQEAKNYTYSQVEIDNKDTAIMNKANNLENANMFKGVNYNNVNGVLTFTRYDDTTKEIDLPLELLVESGYYDEVANELVLVLANGSEIKIPVGNLLTDLDAHNIHFNGSDTNYLVNKLDIESAVKELDTRVKANANDKVDKVAGKQLSDENFTAGEKTKLATIEQDAQKNTVNSVNGKQGDVVLNQDDISDGETYKRVTDVEKSSWSLKQDKLIAGNNITINPDTNVISASGGYININYADLVALRDSNNLKKGAFYRITDYETTTVQEETRSAGHVFDIIVQALDEKTLSENVSAFLHEGDTYFANSKLEAWELKYCLDNDTNRFAWADEVNGKGVIYRMIDEWNNSLPYDFKNIMFARDASVISQAGYTISYEGKKYFYTFSYLEQDETLVDTSVRQDILSDENSYFGTYNNYMDMQYEAYEDYDNPPKWLLSNNVIISDYFYGYYNNTIKGYFSGNTIGGSFFDNVFEDETTDNIIAEDFHNNTIGSHFQYNTIGDSFYYNTIGSHFQYNTIGDSFYYNTIGSQFQYNTIGDSFTDNTIGDNFNNNTIGDSFYYNTIGSYFQYNTIGELFTDNTIENSFYYNTIGDNFNNNTIGDSVQYIQFSEEGSLSNQIRYLYLKTGLKGASNTNPLVLYYDGLYNRKYHTTFEIIANGNIVSSWEETPLTRAGKVKATKTTATWLDI